VAYDRECVCGFVLAQALKDLGEFVIWFVGH
jgi:hypothetical protein